METIVSTVMNYEVERSLTSHVHCISFCLLSSVNHCANCVSFHMFGNLGGNKCFDRDGIQCVVPDRSPRQDMMLF